MRPSFPAVPAAYGARFFVDVLRAIADRLEASREIGQDVDLSNGERLILKSADGARWRVSVAVDGALTAEPL